MDKGMLQIASILAAAMVSTTYVPIDINNPKERIKTIIEQASVELILTTQAYLTRLKGMTWEEKIHKLKDAAIGLSWEKSRVYLTV